MRADLKLGAQLIALMTGLLVALTLAANVKSGLLSTVFGILAFLLLAASGLVIARDS